MTKEKPEITENPVDIGNTGMELILYNDDFNTFEYVIESLIEVCGHLPEQAEQCAIIAHTKGRCAVKTGNIDVLKRNHTDMIKRGLTTKIE